MSIALSIESAEALGSYSLLKAHIAEKMDRDDLTDQIPNFIRMAEFWLNDAIFHPFGEQTTTVSTTAGLEQVALPDGFRQLRAAHYMGDPIVVLQPVSPAVLRDHWATGSGSPQAFSLVNGEMIIGPVPDAVYPISLTYLADLTPLSENNASNWLLRRRADVYVYASLLQAEAHIVNDARLPLWKAALDEAISQLNNAGNRYRVAASPYRLRSPVVV